VTVRTLTSALTIVALTLGCGGSTRIIKMPDAPPSEPKLAELWVEPGKQPRDLFYGIGGRKFVPANDARYKLEAKDELGFSVSYDVVDP
jgi:hypothetical protein